MTFLKKSRYCILAGLIVITQYAWTLWYYGKRYRDGSLLPASQVTAETLFQALAQHIFVNGPEILMIVAAMMLMGREILAREIGLTVRSRKKYALPIAGGLCLLALAAALLLCGKSPLSIGYLWVYYLFFIAFMEEMTFRGLLPYLVEKAGVSSWAVWVLPGVLFSCMHTLMPAVNNGFAIKEFLWQMLFLTGGYTVGHCGFYFLRRWSGTLWLPVLVHGTLDFLGVLTK